LKRVLVLSVVALATVAALSSNAQASQRRGDYGARVGAGHHGYNRVHLGPRTREVSRGGRGFNRGGRGFNRGGRGFNRGGRDFNRGGRGFNRGGRGFNRGGHQVRWLARHWRYYYRGYARCWPTLSFFYDSYGDRVRLIGSGCF
jgi:hypothetical protein